MTPDPVKRSNTTKTSMIKLRLGSDSVSITAGDTLREIVRLLVSESVSFCLVISRLSPKGTQTHLYFRRNYNTVCCYSALSGEVTVILFLLSESRAAWSCSLMQSGCSNSWGGRSASKHPACLAQGEEWSSLKMWSSQAWFVLWKKSVDHQSSSVRAAAKTRLNEK